MKFAPSQKEWRLDELGEFVIQNHPRYIVMTEIDEMWYRCLLSPEAMVPSVVTFKGIPVVIESDK